MNSVKIIAGLLIVWVAGTTLAAERKSALILTRDIGPGEVFEHEGPVELHGNVGESARMIIKAGGLEVQGSVGDNVTLDVEGVSHGRGGYARQSTTIVNDGALIVVNGQMVDVEGGRVPLEGPVDVIVTGQAGGNLTLISGTSAMLRDVGGGADINVQNALSFRTMGHAAKVKAGNTINGNHFGGGVMQAGNTIKLKEIGRGSDVAAGNTLKADRIRADVKAHAGNVLKARRAHNTAMLTAGNVVAVDKRY